jgi:hypothetical protein
MTVVARIDGLISTLQDLRQTASGASTDGDFENALSVAAAQVGAFTSEINQSALPPETEPVALMSNIVSTARALSTRTITSFDDLLRRDLLTNADVSRLQRPNVLQFMDAAGVTFGIASELLYGVIGSNTDLRDWRAIMASDNPVDAARAATRQLYNSDLDYQLGQRAEKGTDAFEEILAERSMVPDETIARAGNFAVVVEPEGDQEPEDAVPFVSAVTSTGLKLREAGGTKEQFERTAWLFGFDLSQVASMAAQTRVRSEHLADVLESLGSSS